MKCIVPLCQNFHQEYSATRQCRIEHYTDSPPSPESAIRADERAKIVKRLREMADVEALPSRTFVLRDVADAIEREAGK